MSSDFAQYNPGTCQREVENLDRRDYIAADESTYFRGFDGYPDDELWRRGPEREAVEGDL